MRFLVSGPVLSILCVPSGLAQVWSTPRVPNLLAQFGVLEIIGMLGLVLGVQVVERAEELVEAVRGRQVLVEVAQMVLAELAGHVALRLEQFGDGHVFLLQAFLRAGQADLEQAGAEWRLPGDEGRAAGGAALLAVPVGKHRAFLGDAVDVRRLVAHHAVIVGADVPPADVVAPDDEDVGLPAARCRGRRGLGLHRRGRRSRHQTGSRECRCSREKHAATTDGAGLAVASSGPSHARCRCS